MKPNIFPDTHTCIIARGHNTYLSRQRGDHSPNRTTIATAEVGILQLGYFPGSVGQSNLAVVALILRLCFMRSNSC